MNTYSRALRHISMKDVNQKHQQKLIEQKIQEEKKKKEEKYISSMMEEKKYDWREKLNEQMTTSDIFYANLPSEGAVDLVSSDVDINFSGGTPGEEGSPSEGFYARSEIIGPVDTTRYNSYEAEGELIVEKKKLKSPEEVLNKIPRYYGGKPSPLGFPMGPPPKTINGYHQDLVDDKKVADRFNRLDPESAKAMPLADNPHIDKKVRVARKKPK